MHTGIIISIIAQGSTSQNNKSPKKNFYFAFHQHLRLFKNESFNYIKKYPGMTPIGFLPDYLCEITIL